MEPRATTMVVPRGARWAWACALALLIVAMLAPWARQRGALRDFFDYGLVMSATGRIAAGERPYVDFTTPIQTGTFLFNGWAEGGAGTFRGMTRGGAACIVLGAVLLVLAYARRWPAVAVVLVAGSIVATTAGQHTIVWHNAIGALAIALAAVGAAAAPLWRRRTWLWHVLVAAALLVGGITKLNAQLVALAAAVAWASREVTVRPAEWRRGVGTLGALALCGLVFPVALELTWTGASVRLWWHNVVALPFESRSAGLRDVWNWRSYVGLPHNFYGPMPITWLGAMAVAMATAVVIAGWRGARATVERGWLIAAALFAVFAGAALLATNSEIAYVAFGAWAGLIAALWVGFAVPARGAWFWGGFVAPVALVGAMAWWSAWEGQRSQFGHSRAARRDYVDGTEAGPDFRYLRGTKIPPELAVSLQSTAAWRAAQPAALRSAIFYGPGLEWLERVWSARKVRGLPLWRHVGTSYGAVEEELLRRALAPGGAYRHVVVGEAWDSWGERLEPDLRHNFSRERLGAVVLLYRGVPEWVVSPRPLEFLEKFGGNTDSTRLFSPMSARALRDGRAFLGIDQGNGELVLRGTTYRMEAAMVVRRRSGNAALPPVRFTAWANEDGRFVQCWAGEIALAAGQEEAITTARIEPGGHPVVLRVAIPPELAGSVEAGWRGLMIGHSADEADDLPFLVPGTAPAVAATPEMRSVLAYGWWESARVMVRDAHLEGGRAVFRPGGEAWFKLSGFYAEISGEAELAAANTSAIDPVVRVVFYKGGRLEMLAQVPVRGGAARFRAWSPEADGWLGILVDNKSVLPPVTLRITRAQRP